MPNMTTFAAFILSFIEIAMISANSATVITTSRARYISVIHIDHHATSSSKNVVLFHQS